MPGRPHDKMLLKLRSVSMNKSIVTVLAFSGLLCAFIFGMTNKNTAHASPKEVTVYITGMVCTGCSNSVSATLKKMPGVVGPIHVSHKTHSAKFSVSSKSSLKSIVDNLNSSSEKFKFALTKPQSHESHKSSTRKHHKM